MANINTLTDAQVRKALGMFIDRLDAVSTGHSDDIDAEMATQLLTNAGLTCERPITAEDLEINQEWAIGLALSLPSRNANDAIGTPTRVLTPTAEKIVSDWLAA